MKKFLNDPSNLTKELLEGFAIAHARTVRLAGKNLVVRSVPKSKDKVAVVTLGGSGHEPALSGFVGEGMLDVSVPGEIFAAPGPPRVLEALRLADRPAGVLLLVLNHAGDVMSANIALDMARKEGLNVKQVLTHEDISAGTRQEPDERRGLVGCLPVIKVAGAAAERGRSLDQCVAVAERMERNMATLAVAVSAATHPCTGAAISELADDEMVVGMGQHGESGLGSRTLASADEMADIMLPALLDDLQVRVGEDLLVLLNGVGSTTLMELYLVLRRVKQILEVRNVKLVRSLVGEYLTVQEMGGFQMCIARMDPELIALWDARCDSPALTMC
ncbi:MAG: dihydroxyacetone kinase subunit DhaK [Thermoguttaceae bacterium]